MAHRGTLTLLDADKSVLDEWELYDTEEEVEEYHRKGGHGNGYSFEYLKRNRDFAPQLLVDEILQQL